MQDIIKQTMVCVKFLIILHISYTPKVTQINFVESQKRVQSSKYPKKVINQKHIALLNPLPSFLSASNRVNN